jgi:phage protein U
MLFQLGTLTVEVLPFNVHEVTLDAGADFAAKDVIGALKPREFTGEGDSTLKLTGRVFPERFGGLDELGLLEQMRLSGEPQILVRGDGMNRGWWLVTKYSLKETYLDATGVGRVIDVDIELTKAPGAGAPAGLLTTLYRLLS